MANSVSPAEAQAPPAVLSVSVCYAGLASRWVCELELPPGATVAMALAASGFARAHPGLDPWVCGVGIFGRLATPDLALETGDRVEIYRPLSFDPMVSRRRRAAHRTRQKMKQ
jgi:putative ubiquitin-RnfH superfamily antitoxin RatB of RatAB toxin-antitoxin module